MTVRHRSRHLRATLMTKVVDDLTTLGWVTAPINFDSQPVTVVDYLPDERNEPILRNTVAVSFGDTEADQDAELGAEGAGLRVASYPVFLDVYMAEQALSDAICDDLRDTFDNASIPLVDQTTGQPTDEKIIIADVLGPRLPIASASIEPFKRFWRTMRLDARVYYLD